VLVLRLPHDDHATVGAHRRLSCRPSARGGLVADRLASPAPVRHVHFGGGTPTIMAPSHFRDLIAVIARRFRLDPDAEIAVEVDPRALTPAMASSLGEAGVTRASLGVQSFDPAVQQAVNRIQSVEQTASASERLRSAGVRGINIDLVYGLPRQTTASCIETVRECLRLRPDRFSVFGYAHVPSFKKHQRMIDVPEDRARSLRFAE
jgi:oxygen-independent coproporphyrinogen-3 oxidase